MDSVKLWRRLCFFSSLLCVFIQAYGATFHFRGDLNWPSDRKFQDVLVGGLSGCVYDAQRDVLLAVSDDKSEKGPARFYELKVTWPTNATPASKPQVDILRAVPLLNDKGKNYRIGSIDPEAIALSVQGNVLIAQEGSGQVSPRQAPSVMEFTREGRYLRTLPLPAVAQPTPDGPPLHGARHNLGFESLGLSADGRLWAAMEAPLLQDGPEATLTQNGLTRLFSWRYARGWFAAAQYAVEIEAAPNPEKLTQVVGFNSVAEILPLNKQELLWVERGNVIRDGVYLRTSVRVFSVDPTGASDVAAHETLEKKKFNRATKKLVFDFDTLLSQLSENYRSIDNLEALCWGPRLAGGMGRSLIAISDNNFSAKQRTQWVFLEYR